MLLGHDAQDEGVLAVAELVGSFRVLPGVVLLHQVHVVQGHVVEVRVDQEGRVLQVVGRVDQGKDLIENKDPRANHSFCFIIMMDSLFEK